MVLTHWDNSRITSLQEALHTRAANMRCCSVRIAILADQLSVSLSLGAEFSARGWSPTPLSVDLAAPNVVTEQSRLSALQGKKEPITNSPRSERQQQQPHHVKFSDQCELRQQGDIALVLPIQLQLDVCV